MADEIDKKMLLAFLFELDSKLRRRIKMVAAGGTAMTLLDLKPATKDIDFEFDSEDYEEFKFAEQSVFHSFRIDKFFYGLIFSQQLPADYREISIPIKGHHFRNIELYALHPIDIVASKIGRLNERDKQDIAACIERFGLTKKRVEQRAKPVEYVGREENYMINLAHVLRVFFGKKPAAKFPGAKIRVVPQEKGKKVLGK